MLYGRKTCRRVSWSALFIFDSDTSDSWMSSCSALLTLPAAFNVRLKCVWVTLLLGSGCIFKLCIPQGLNNNVFIPFPARWRDVFCNHGRILEQPPAPLTTFFSPLPRSYQALLRGDDTARLLHPAPATGRQHGRHLPGAPLSAGHRPGANHSTQHWHHLHHRWVLETRTPSF